MNLKQMLSIEMRWRRTNINSCKDKMLMYISQIHTLLHETMHKGFDNDGHVFYDMLTHKWKLTDIIAQTELYMI